LFGCDHFRRNERSAPHAKAEVTRGIAFSLVARIIGVKHLRQSLGQFEVKFFPNLVLAAQMNAVAPLL
jgi:hypothetical protein